MNQISTAVLDRYPAHAEASAVHKRQARRHWRPTVANFCVLVLLPTLLAGLYFGFIAAPIYVSEAKFVVRSVAPPASNAFTSYLQTTGITRSQDDTATVQDFMESRAALRQIEPIVSIRSLYERVEADRLARFPRPWDSATFEGLFRYFRDRTQVAHNDTTGIVTLTTTGFRPRDVYAINRALLEAGSDLLRRMNERARTDAIKNSGEQVSQAERRLLEAQAEITAFRNKELMVDPSRTSTKILDLVARLSGDLATTRARRAETQASAPESAALPFLANRIEALEEQIASERSKVVGTNAAIAPRIAEYERLTLRREFADKALVAASNALDGARADARRQQLYLEVVVAPDLPDEALLPERSKDVLVVFLAAFILYFIGWLAVFAIRDYTSG